MLRRDDDIQKISASDEELRAILAEAEVPPLLPALAYVTGDLSLLRADLRPNPLTFGMPQGGDITLALQFSFFLVYAAGHIDREGKLQIDALALGGPRDGCGNG